MPIYIRGSDDLKGMPAHIQVIRFFLRTNQQTDKGIPWGPRGPKNTEPQLSTLVCLSGNKMLRKEFNCVGNVIDGQFLTRVLPPAAAGAGWAAALRRLIFQIYARHWEEENFCEIAWRHKYCKGRHLTGTNTVKICGNNCQGVGKYFTFCES